MTFGAICRTKTQLTDQLPSVNRSFRQPSLVDRYVNIPHPSHPEHKSPGMEKKMNKRFVINGYET